MARRSRKLFAKERDAIRSRGGMVRMSDALRLGITRKALYPRGRNSGAASQHRPDILMRHDYALRVVTRDSSAMGVPRATCHRELRHDGLSSPEARPYNAYLPVKRGD